MALHFYHKHPKEDYELAIESKHPTGGLQRRGSATLFQAGDETTWLGGRLSCRLDPAEDPLAEEDEARAHHGDERGAARLVAKDCNGLTSPSQMKRHRESNL
jgi:hypothetical protein